MTWTKLSDNYADRLEDLELTPTACWLHTAALIYCNRVGSDGRLPFSKIGKVASVPAADLYVAELEQQGLWTRLDGDGAWQVDWTDQEPAEDVRRRREGANDRQRRARQHRAGDHSLCAPERLCRRVTRDVTRDVGSVDESSGVSTGVTRDVTGPRPVPTRPGPKEPGKGRRPRATEVPPRCAVPGHDGRGGFDSDGDPHCGQCAEAQGKAAS